MCVRVCVNKSNNICLKKQEYTMEKQGKYGKVQQYQKQTQLHLHLIHQKACVNSTANMYLGTYSCSTGCACDPMRAIQHLKDYYLDPKYLRVLFMHIIFYFSSNNEASDWRVKFVGMHALWNKFNYINLPSSTVGRVPFQCSWLGMWKPLGKPHEGKCTRPTERRDQTK